MQYNNCFNNYLNKFLVQEETHDDRCLISGDTLLDNHILLPCNHKFNYKEIYTEFKNQKNKTNKNEIVSLLKNEVKCPYCRTVHKYLLPFNDNYDYNKFIMKKKEHSGKCVAVLKSGKNKGEICNRKCEKLLCYFHINYIIK